MTGSREFDAVAASVRRSVMFRAADAIAAAFLSAADRSGVALRIRNAWAQCASLTSDARLQAVAIFVAAAAAGHWLLLFLIPAQVAPATPKALWLIIAGTASIVALCARPLAADWETSILRKVTLGDKRI